MWVVILGTLVEGHRFIGPFQTSDLAKEWVQEFPDDFRDTAIIIDLLNPVDLLKEAKNFMRKNMQ